MEAEPTAWNYMTAKGRSTRFSIVKDRILSISWLGSSLRRSGMTRKITVPPLQTPITTATTLPDALHGLTDGPGNDSQGQTDLYHPRRLRRVHSTPTAHSALPCTSVLKIVS